jgi:REP element-mobilizing transposase RayT
MARPLRIEYPGAVYHLTARGNARQPIFRDDADRELFLSTPSHVISRYAWRCHAYCLMANHYHLLVETPKANLSRGMRQLNGVYTQAFNRRLGRVGHLFQGRYKAILVEKEAHLLELCRYVVLNPLRVKARQRVEDWRWGSYRATAGLAPLPNFLTVDLVLGHFGQPRRKA